MKTCGDYGGILRNGRPCGHKAGWGVKEVGDEGRCKNHHERVTEKQEVQKKEFLRLIDEAGASMEGACKEIGSSVTAVWRWRQSDPEFDKAVTETWYASEARRVEHVESAFVNKLLNGNAGTGEWVFYLCNRAPRRWQNVHHIRHANPDGKPITPASPTQIVNVYIPANNRDELPKAIQMRMSGKASDNGAGD